MPVVYEPSLCLAVSGRKRVLIGDASFIYDSAQFLVVSVDLPVNGMVVDASADDPYLCLKLDLDVAVLSDLLLAHDARVPHSNHAPSIAVGDTDAGLLDAALRLLRLLDTPADIAALAPLIEREILYRLLTGPQGAMLRHIATADTRLHQISRAVTWIKDHYASSFSIDHLAGLAGMSPSSFHEHFKSVTRFSPLQYRTRLRLLDAALDGLGGDGRGECGLPRRLRKPVPIQSRLQPRLWSAAAARRRATPRGARDRIIGIAPPPISTDRVAGCPNARAPGRSHRRGRAR